jgi:predicted site-specific integrase-resolvase
MDSAHGKIAQQGHLISVGQAALELSVSGQSIRNWCKAGLLDYIFTAGGHRRLLKSSLREYQGLDPEPRRVKKLRRPLNSGDSCTSEI